MRIVFRHIACKIFSNNLILHYYLFCLKFRQIFPNGTLYFPPFAGTYYRADVHENIYRCKASNVAGTILSRDVHVSAGIYHIQLKWHRIFELV